MEVLFIVAIVIGFYMAWNIGANDVANSMADAVGSRALTVFWAVILAAIFEFAGAFLVGSHVTDTVRKGIINPESFAADPHVLALGLVCALLAAAVWLNVASIFGAPVSTTHSIVGAIAGFGVMAADISEVDWGTVAKIISSWFISPIAGGLIGFITFKLITRFILAKPKPIAAALIGVPVCAFFTFATMSMATIYKGLKNLNLDLSGPDALLVSSVVGLVAAVIVGIALRKRWKGSEEGSLAEQLAQVEKVFVVMVIMTSCSVAFAHGANDVSNAIGPLAAVVDIIKTNSVSAKVAVPLWILALGGAGIVVGLGTFGYRVMRTVGSEITEISPSRGVAADMGAMITVLVCSHMGLPISTTHTLVGAIIGVGLARGLSAINIATVRTIFMSWIITLPVVAVITMIFYKVAMIFTGW
jgi:PiT family inorganic phosphate transporter